MILPKNKYRAFGYFGMATFYYVAFASQMLAGMIPRGTGDPAKYYRENTGFFWTYIFILFLVFLYQAIRGIYLYCKRLRRDTDPPEIRGFTPRIASLITSAITIPIGLCFLILPVVELIKQIGYGGYAFGNHPMTGDAGAFWGLLIFQLVIAVIPILGGTLLIVFPPRHVEPIAESPLVEMPLSGRPKMKTSTKIIIAAASGVLIVGLLAVAGIVGGSYYLFKRIDNPELVKKREAARSDGTDFGKTTDQNGCMEKAFTLATQPDSFDMSNHYFTKACLKSSRPTANFCDGVPFVFDRDWFKNQCNAVGKNNEACTEAFTAKRDFCRLDGDNE